MECCEMRYLNRICCVISYSILINAFGLFFVSMNLFIWKVYYNMILFLFQVSLDRLLYVFYSKISTSKKYLYYYIKFYEAVKAPLYPDKNRIFPRANYAISNRLRPKRIYFQFLNAPEPKRHFCFDSSR